MELYKISRGVLGGCSVIYCLQVVSLLKSIGLEAYVELFKAECISGDILQEVDDNLLDKELGITSKLHRIKMRRLINGRFPHSTYIPENL